MSRIKLDPRDIDMAGSSTLMHSMVTHIDDIVYAYCLALMSLVLLPAQLSRKGQELVQHRDPDQM